MIKLLGLQNLIDCISIYIVSTRTYHQLVEDTETMKLGNGKPDFVLSLLTLAVSLAFY